MSTMRIERVTALPGTVTASTMYVVKSGVAGLVDIYFTNNDGTETRHIVSQTEINSMVNNAVASFNNMEVTATIATRNAMALTRNAMVLVLDATADATVAIGGAAYVYEFATTTWTKISEFAEMDAQIKWADINDKPTSAVADIDDAVAKRHSHANKATLDKLAVDGDGELTVGGKNVQAYVAVSGW